MFRGGRICKDKEILPDGTVREGEFRDGRLYKGKEVKKVGDEITVREGKFQFGLLHGEGEERLPDGTVREGEFRDCRLYKGKERLPDGTVNIVIRDSCVASTSKESSTASRSDHKPANDVIIDTTQIHPAGNCCSGFGYDFHPLKYWLLQLFHNLSTEESGVSIGSKEIIVKGLGSGVFGSQIPNVFLYPNNIKAEQVAFLLKQILKHNKSEEPDLTFLQSLTLLTAHSASGPSIIALNDLLEEKLDEFFADVAKALNAPDQTYNTFTVQQLEKGFESLAAGFESLAASTICENCSKLKDGFKSLAIKSSEQLNQWFQNLQSNITLDNCSDLASSASKFFLQKKLQMLQILQIKHMILLQ